MTTNPNPAVVALLFTIDMESLMHAVATKDRTVIRHTDGSPLTDDETQLALGATFADLDAAKQLHQYEVDRAHEHVTALDRMSDLVKQYATEPNQQVESVRLLMPVDVRAQFDALASIVAPDGYVTGM